MRQMLSRVLVSLGLLVGCSTTALATTTYTIDVGNSALTGFTGPYATVTVNLLDATHATVTFDSLINGGYWYLMGGAQAADVQVNGSFSVSPIVATGPTNPGFTAPSCSNGGANNADGWGKFNLTIDCFDGFTNAADQISFTLTLLSGTWASDAVVLTQNKSGNVTADHVFACPVTNGDPATCSSANGAAVTGFASENTGGGPPVTIPEPQTLALLGIGLVVLAFMRRRQVG